jgi:hypothetical protein
VTQCLDYLGITFRCTSCGMIGQLRSDCTKEPEEDESKASYLCNLSREDSPGIDSFVAVNDDYTDIGDYSSSPLDTLTGKLKQHCPTFYYTLNY